MEFGVGEEKILSTSLSSHLKRVPIQVKSVIQVNFTTCISPGAANSNMLHETMNNLAMNLCLDAFLGLINPRKVTGVSYYSYPFKIKFQRKMKCRLKIHFQHQVQEQTFGHSLFHAILAVYHTYICYAQELLQFVLLQNYMEV